MTLTCGYYVRRADASLWAVQARNGQAEKAIGPLRPGSETSPPMKLDWEQAQDAQGWNLDLDFIKPKGVWRLAFGPPLHPMLLEKKFQRFGPKAFRIGIN